MYQLARWKVNILGWLLIVVGWNNLHFFSPGLRTVSYKVGTYKRYEWSYFTPINDRKEMGLPVCLVFFHSHKWSYKNTHDFFWGPTLYGCLRIQDQNRKYTVQNEMDLLPKRVVLSSLVVKDFGEVPFKHQRVYRIAILLTGTNSHIIHPGKKTLHAISHQNDTKWYSVIPKIHPIKNIKHSIDITSKIPFKHHTKCIESYKGTITQVPAASEEIPY